MAEKSSASISIGFGGLLTIVFITLKLCHVIDWSWWWVLAPLWAPWVVILGVMLIVLAFLGVVAVVNAMLK